MLPTLHLTPQAVVVRPPDAHPQDGLSAPRLAVAALRCAPLHATPGPDVALAPGTPEVALARVLERESGGLSSTCGLTLQAVRDEALGDAEGQDAELRERAGTLLMLRYRVTVPFTLRPVRAAWDRESRGALGGLLGELRAAASSLCPLFTPQDALEENPWGEAPYLDRSDLLTEGRRRLGRGTPLDGLTPGEINRRLRAAGQYTCSDRARLGWTLGMDVPRGGALDAALLRCSSPLQARAQRVRHSTAALVKLARALPCGDYPDCVTLDECCGDPDAAFLVTQGGPRDLLTELYEEQLQQQQEATHPLHCVVWDTPNDLRRSVRAALSFARALRVTRGALLALGAEQGEA